MKRLRNWIASHRISRQLARSPEWQRQVAESRAAFADWQARGCPEDELATVDDLRRMLHLEPDRCSCGGVLRAGQSECSDCVEEHHLGRNER